MPRNPTAVAKALIRANATTATTGAGQGGFGNLPQVVPNGAPSPLVQDYGAWTSGRTQGRGLPRDPYTFLAGSFGPLAPIQPIPIDQPDPDTDRTDPRRWQYPVSWNMPHGVPGDEGLKLASFSTLRTIADTYSVARACVQIRKNELLGLGWDVVPTKSAEKAMRGDVKARREFEARRAKMLAFWRRPDVNYFAFRDWFSVLLEDVLVVDALSLYQWPARRPGKGVLGSDLGQLAAIDGSTIRPLVDTHGAIPLPPNPGYQQYLFGVPRTDLVTMLAGEDVAGLEAGPDKDYRADQLIYRPQNPRDWTVYGFAPIEQALVPVLSGIQRQQFQLDFFSEGTIPGLFISNGDPNATPNQNRELQDALNAMAGDPAWKHKIIVLPANSKIDPQRPVELAGTFDEIIMTQVCMAFSVMPMELGITPRASSSGASAGAHNQMGKMSSDTQERKANRPMLEWFADIFNHLIQGVCGQPDMQWWWEGLEEDEDEQTKTNIQAKKVSIGLMSVDEARVENGQQPWSLPTTSDPVLITPTGVIPFGSIDPSTGQPEGLTAKLTAAPPPPGLPAAPPRDGDAGETGGEGPAGDQPAKPNPPKPTSGPGGAGMARPPAKPTAKPAATPAHAAALQHPTGQQPAKAYSTQGALRELDLLRRRIAKGRGIGGWSPVDLPPHVFGPLADAVRAGQGDQAVAAARLVVKADAHRARRDDALAEPMDTVVQGLRTLAADLGAGTVSTAGFVDAAVEVMRRGIRHALQAGLTHATTTGKAAAPVDTGRLNLYAGQLVNSYEQGMALGTLGDANDPDRIAVRWHAREGACELCDARNGTLFAVADLPGFPGEGGFGPDATVCLGGPHCRCTLEYVTLTRDEATDRAGTGPVASGQWAADVAAVRTALASPDPQAALTPVLDGIAGRLATGQRPYLEGLLQDILAALGTQTVAVPVSMGTVPQRTGTAGHSHDGEPGGLFGDLVMATIIAAAVAAAIAAQERSQQQAAPATQPAPEGQEPVTKHSGHADLTHEVYAYLARHYPASVLEWVKDAHWHPPQQVNLSDIDMGRRPGGARDPDKVKAIAHAIEDGHHLDPIVLVRTPTGLPYQIADGWHRTLALIHTGRRTALAWVGDVDTDDGDWGTAMNQAKLNT